jgi:hypothetical protein
MRGYILKTGTRIAPFDDDVGDVLVLNRRLEDCQKEALSAFCESVEVIQSLDQARGEEFLLVEDHLYLSRHFLKRAVKTAKKTNGSLRFALGASVFLKEKAALGGLALTDGQTKDAHAPLPLLWWRGPGQPDTEKLAALPLCRVFIKEKKFIPGNLQNLHDDLEIEYSMTRDGVQSVRHWTHILDVNQLALAAFWLDFSPLRILWLLWKIITAFSFSKWVIGENINVIGSGSEIHPTAWVAGCIIGKNVTIGPHTTVFGSVLGDGAKVEGQSELSFAVLGERAVASFHTRVAFSVCYPMSMVSYPAAQMCLLGRRSMHMGGCYPIDMKLSQGQLLDVKVKQAGKIVDSGKKFLGACIGHRSIVGTGLWLNSGLEVPNDHVVVRDRDDLVIKIPEGFAGQTLSLQGGKLKPYQR